MNIVKVILILSFVAICTEVASAGHFGGVDLLFKLGSLDGLGSLIPSKKLDTKRGAWYWYKPGVDIEQLQKDYAECRKEEWICMVYKKGYDWWPWGTGYWHKGDGTIEQLQYDYGQCKGRDTPCMEKKGYTWVQKCWN
jgi:hypothetical protein